MSFLQTLAAAFKGGPARVPLARTYNSPWILAEARASRAPFEYGDAVKRAYLDNPVAQRAVRLVAESVGQAPLLPVDESLAALISETSAGQPLLETLAAHLVLHGNAFVQVIKDGRGLPVELFALRPERMSAQLGEDGWPVAWLPEAKLAVELDRVPALAEDRERLWSQVTAADFLSDDEKRALLGLPPREGAVAAPASKTSNSRNKS